MSAIASTSDDHRVRLRLWLKLLRTTRTIERDLRERLAREFGTTLPRFDVMAALDRTEHGMTMGELSRALLVSNGNVTGIVERLVSDGLVARTTRDNDRRTSIVRLTPDGRRAFAAVAAAHARWIDEALDAVTPEAARTITDTLAAFGNRAETHA